MDEELVLLLIRVCKNLQTRLLCLHNPASVLVQFLGWHCNLRTAFDISHTK
jgi:hypothetical protein